MEEDYIIWEVHKKIQKNVSAFSVEGVFLFFLMGWLIFCFIILMLIKSILGVILASIVTVALFLIVALIAIFLSQRYGIRGLCKKIGAGRQPSEIICTKINFTIKNERN